LPNGEPMKARGYTELTTTESPDELQFRAVHHHGWIDLIYHPVFDLVFLTFLLVEGIRRHQEKWAYALGLVVIFLLLRRLRICVLRWLHEDTETLTVRRSGIAVTRNLGWLSSAEVTVTASELMEPGYGLAGGIQFGVPHELKYSDFRLERGRKSRRVLEGLDQSQKRVVSDLIFKRFPEAIAGAGGPASLLFGDQTGITALGLSASQPKSPDLGERHSLPTGTP
jgi:hypothetical protein